ncbi:MAG TPA: secretin N-terminal domain-containing protein [Thermoanaerobaculia bacterium]|nr:secretin N-terminal domain-containing protein [Thermoanaerobaculia bacterium]
MRRFAPMVCWLVLFALLSSCSSYRSYRQAQMAASAEDWDKAVLYYLKAVEKNPDNITYRASLLRAKIRAAQEHFNKARRYYETGLLERAFVDYQQAVQLDPSNQSAAVELEKVRRELEAASQNRKSESIEDLKKRVSEQNQPPVLNPRSNEPIDLYFPEPVSMMSVYRALGRAFGINIMFDPNLKDTDISVELKQVRAQDALEFLMRTAGHFYKVLDEQSIIIIADTPQNRRNYEDLVIKTFFLSNAEVKEVVTMLRSLIDAKKIATNEQLNAIIVRDTADKVRVAERIIEANDKARAEVVVDVELLQINTTKLRDLGVTWPSSITTRIDTGGENVPLRLSDLQFLNQSNWTLTIPSFTYDFVKTSTDAQLLAKPQLRISEGEKASLTIGDRIPIPVTSFNTANTVGGNIVPITSFQYQDVGIKINLEPRVHHNKEVTLKVTVEVSNLSGQVTTGGSSQPIIGTRSFESKIRLKDGETNFLAGLIRTDETVSENGLPGLSEIPVIGRLFSKNRNQNQRTDVILTLTPHIIRAADITEEDLLPIWVGTEQNITFRGGSPRVESEVEGPFDAGGEAESSEEVKELIQRRIQQLPRELRDQAGAGVEEEVKEPPRGVELVPGAPPQGGAPSGGTGGAFGTPPQPVPEDESGEEPPFGTPVGGGSGGRGPSFGGGTASSALRLDHTPPAVVLATRVDAPVRLKLAPRELAVSPEDVFEVSVMVEAGRPVAHLPIKLTFDPEVLAVLEVRRGDFLGSAEEAQVLSDLSRPGEVVIGASRLGERPGITGKGVVAVVRLQALRPGNARIDFRQANALSSSLEALSPVTGEPAAVWITNQPERERPAREREVES